MDRDQELQALIEAAKADIAREQLDEYANHRDYLADLGNLDGLAQDLIDTQTPIETSSSNGARFIGRLKNASIGLWLVETETGGRHGLAVAHLSVITLRNDLLERPAASLLPGERSPTSRLGLVEILARHRALASQTSITTLGSARPREFRILNVNNSFATAQELPSGAVSYLICSSIVSIELPPWRASG